MILRDIYECREVKLDESVKRTGVLGVVEGVFFVPEKPSRNGRIYPRALWERVLRSSDLNRLLENRLMIGTVGHEDIDFDALIREQKVSHVVTKLWLGENGMGYGRAEILDTPVGRILYTLLKSGSKFAVSSKGWGEFSGTTSDGLQIVDANQYILERFDFVVDPGFLDAVPYLKEQYESYVVGNVGREVNSKLDVMEVVMKEKMILQEKLNEMMSLVKKYEEENKELKEKLSKQGTTSASNKLDETFEKCLGVRDVNEVKNEVRLLSKLIEEEAEALVKRGVPSNRLEGETLSEVLAKVIHWRDSLYRRRLRNVKESLLRAAKKEIKEAKEMSDNSVKYRSMLRRMRRMLVSESLKVNRLKKLLSEAKRELAKVYGLGGAEGIATALTMMERFLKKLIRNKLVEEAEKLSAKYGISLDEAKKMISEVGVKRANELARKSIRESVSRVSSLQEAIVVTQEEEVGSSAIVEGRASLADRILGYISKRVNSE